MRPNRLLALLPGVILTLSACGSTVQVAPNQGALEGVNQEGREGVSFLGNGLAGRTPGAGSGGASQSSAANGADALGVTAQTSGSPSQGPIQIGVSYTTNAEAAYKALGIDASLGDQKAMADALVAYVNKHGGFAGRRIVPVFYNQDAMTFKSGTQWQQERCATWTQDNHVVAVVNHGGPPLVQSCLSAKRIPYSFGTNEPYTRQEYQKWSFGHGVGTLSAEDGGRLLIRRARAQGYFKATGQDLGPTVRLGLLFYDTSPQHGVVDSVIVPEAKTAGAVFIDQVALLKPDTTEQGGQTIAQIQNAALKFAADGVTHVIILDNGGNITFNFPQYAEQQQYRPRYAWNTHNVIGIEQAYVPKAQLVRSVGVGWQPQVDVAEAQGPKPNAASAECTSILEAAGVDTVWGAPRHNAFVYCDEFFALQRAANVRGSVDGPGMVSALAASGEFLQATTFRASYGPMKNWGAAAYRDLEYEASCSCMAYVGPEGSVAETLR